MRSAESRVRVTTDGLSFRWRCHCGGWNANRVTRCEYCDCTLALDEMIALAQASNRPVERPPLVDVPAALNRTADSFADTFYELTLVWLIAPLAVALLQWLFAVPVEEIVATFIIMACPAAVAARHDHKKAGGSEENANSWLFLTLILPVVGLVMYLLQRDWREEA